jgi:N-acyl homoserine lactone hydrolase
MSGKVMAGQVERAGWRIDVLVQGYPGKTVCHGSLGWSTITLLRGHGRVVLLDVGSFNVRRLLIDKLAACGLVPGDVTDVLLSHAHWDHMVNWTLFSHARIAIGAQELAWARTAPWGATPVPELYVEQLATWPTLDALPFDADVLPGMRALAAPGHTPGHVLYLLEDAQRGDVLFTGDAAKNRTELLQRSAHQTMDAGQTRHSLHTIWELWRRRPGSVLVPGHDLPMVIDSAAPGGVRYLGTREAAIDSWQDDTLEQITTFALHA